MKCKSRKICENWKRRTYPGYWVGCVYFQKCLMRLAQGLIPLPVVLIQGGCNQVWHSGSGGRGKTEWKGCCQPRALSRQWTKHLLNQFNLISSCSENRWFFPLSPVLLWHQDRLFSTYAWSVFSAMVPRTHSVFCFFSTCLLRWKLGMIHEIPATPPCEPCSYGFFTSISSHILSHSRTSRVGRATGIPSGLSEANLRKLIHTVCKKKTLGQSLMPDLTWNLPHIRLV